VTPGEEEEEDLIVFNDTIEGPIETQRERERERAL
jgi:hypothetical protein